jgi:hypothetical protein
VEAVNSIASRGEHQLAHYLWVPDSDLQGNGRSHAVAEEIGLFDAKLLQRSGRVISHLFIREWAINVGGTAVALHLEGDDLPGSGKLRQKFAK